jgi:hypothetical protein
MKWPRNFVIRPAAICVTLALMGCGSEPTSPRSVTQFTRPSVAYPNSVVARSVNSQWGWAGFFAGGGPAVQVLDQFGHPMANVSVSFAVTRGGGSVLTASMKTDQNGLAITKWILGKQGGPNTVVASVDTLDGVSFQANATVPVIVARYDLEEVGGAPLPVQYSNDPRSLITGGHILIAADDSFAWGLDINGVGGLAPVGTIVRVDASTVNFYAPQPDEDGISGAWATGLIEGNTMLFTIDEFMISHVQKYVLKN